MNLIQSQQLHSKWNQNKQRMNYVAKLIDFYMNNQYEYTEETVRKIFVNTKPTNLIKTYPIVERIINDISMLFQQKPEVSIKGVKAQKQLLEKILNQSKFYNMLITVNRLVTLTGKLAVIPKYYKGKIHFDIITADRCFVKQVQNFPTQVQQFYYWIAPSTNSNVVQLVNRWVKITDTTISQVEIDSSGTVRKQYNQQPNQLGLDLVVWFQNQYIYDSFFPDKQQPIVTMNQYYNLHKTFETVALFYQSTSTLVTKGIALDKDMPFGPRHTIHLPQVTSNEQTDAKYITPDTNFEALYRFTDMLQQMAVVYAGLSSDAYKNTSQFQSGWHLELAKLDIINQNKMEQPFYKTSIVDLVKAICFVWTESDPNTSFKDNVDVTVDFAQLKVKDNLLEQWQIWQKELQHNIISQVDLLIKTNPDLHIDQANKIHKNNKILNSSLLEQDNQNIQEID